MWSAWAAISGNYSWEFLDREPDRWSRFPAETEIELEAARKSGQTSLSVSIFDYTYDINLRDGTQRNHSTNRLRRIRRKQTPGVELCFEFLKRACDYEVHERLTRSQQAVAAESAARNELELQAQQLKQALAAESAARNELELQAQQLKQALAAESAARNELELQAQQLKQALAAESAARNELELQAQQLKQALAAESAARNELKLQIQLLEWYYNVFLSRLGIPSMLPTPVAPRSLHIEDGLFLAISAMFQASMVRHRLNHQSDQWCEPPNVVVTRILQVVSGRKVDEYQQARRYRCTEDSHCSPIDGMTAVKCEVEHGWRDLNEYLLFHGTSYTKSNVIAHEGLDAQRGGESVGAMFGRGVYFAQNASKSDFYTTCKDCTTDSCRDCTHAEGERCILLTRVLLGESLIVKHTDRTVQNWIRAPDKPTGGPYDSITAASKDDGGVVDHMEFVVFKDPRMLVQFQVFYRHVAACSCHNCQYRRR